VIADIPAIQTSVHRTTEHMHVDAYCSTRNEQLLEIARLNPIIVESFDPISARPEPIPQSPPVIFNISINRLSRCCSSAATSLPSSSSCTLAVSLSIFSGVPEKAFSRMSSFQTFVDGPRCSSRCLKPSAPPPPPIAFAMKGPTVAQRGPRLVVTQVSAQALPHCQQTPNKHLHSSLIDVRNNLTELLRRDNPPRNQTISLIAKRDLQTVCNKSGDFLFDVDRLATEAYVEFQRGGYRRIAGARVRDDFDQRHEVRWVERVADEDPLWVFALADELGAWDAGRGRGDHDVFARFGVDFGEEG
jgi:hypothetical protein